MWSTQNFKISVPLGPNCTVLLHYKTPVIFYSCRWGLRLSCRLSLFTAVTEVWGSVAGGYLHVSLRFSHKLPPSTFPAPKPLDCSIFPNICSFYLFTWNLLLLFFPEISDCFIIFSWYLLFTLVDIILQTKKAREEFPNSINHLFDFQII